ncbi:APC family permease [Vagococcus carniphilus]|uniref:Amino acid permease n=1 Tax=Vagococcus carniphilus TaxID=218144 RepID=A0AAW8U3W5_9ENTE|nr:amino acid permease [Vagococcus carniphilus]MDT2830383.1 amino acid permease [Vagococcus carniphilus]MDT2834305.1 amino acid permease [Vagococcus carniphilus]MDT2840048.1 amino acid permease [Vagococcus carniphilus]MDT2854539.1 amino acid permease [Vagococcus carniphilus]MDT2863921.1 amino acid permease [Vagococcus carniphilus]
MEEEKLKKEITLLGAFSTVMGTVIGAGVFFKVATVTKESGSARITLLAWLVGGLLTLCAGLTSAELATAIPKTGGAVKYIEYTYGKLWGFLLGWAQMLIYFPANIAALSIIFSTQLINLFHLKVSLLVPIAMIVGFSVTGINLLGTKVASRFQSVSLVLKLIPILLIIVVGLFKGSGETVSFVPSTLSNHSAFSRFSGALFATLFAYDGWLGVGAVAGEMKRPEKDLPKAIFLGLLFITAVYVVINYVFLKTLPIEALSGNENAASNVANVLFGEVGGKIVTLGILLSVYGALNGYTMTGIRVPYALAKENLIPGSQWLSRLSKRTKVPYMTALVQISIAFIMINLGSFDLLTDMLIFVIWLFSVMIFFAVFILRKREPELNRPYKVPFYPLIPTLAIVGGIFILSVTLLTQTKLALTGILITAIGIPVFYIQKNILLEENKKTSLK